MNKNMIFVFLTTSSVFFFSTYIITLNKFKKTSKDLIKLRIDNAVMQEYIDIVKSQNSLDIPDELIDKENFIKFLSDSRDWAYKYIEDVQMGLTSFVNEVEPEIAYFDEYGLVGDAYPHYHSMKKISEEYKKLKKLLPTEEKQ